MSTAVVGFGRDRISAGSLSTGRGRDKRVLFWGSVATKVAGGTVTALAMSSSLCGKRREACSGDWLSAAFARSATVSENAQK